MYLVKAPLLAVCRDRAEKAFLTVPRESLISIEGPIEESGLVEIRYRGDILLAFMSDIEERAELLHSEEPAHNQAHRSSAGHVNMNVEP